MIEAPPPDAIGGYEIGGGKLTWIKELDLRMPWYPLAFVWSLNQRRWEKRRRRVQMRWVRLFNAEKAQ